MQSMSSALCETSAEIFYRGLADNGWLKTDMVMMGVDEPRVLLISRLIFGGRDRGYRACRGESDKSRNR